MNFEQSEVKCNSCGWKGAFPQLYFAPHFTKRACPQCESEQWEISLFVLVGCQRDTDFDLDTGGQTNAKPR